MTFSLRENSPFSGKPTVLYKFMLSTSGDSGFPPGPPPPGGLVVRVPLSTYTQARDVSQTHTSGCFPVSPESAICGPHTATGFTRGITVWSAYNPVIIDSGENAYFYAQYFLADSVQANHAYVVRVLARKIGTVGSPHVSGVRVQTLNGETIIPLNGEWSWYDIPVTTDSERNLWVAVGGFNMHTGAAIVTGLASLTVYDPALPPPIVPTLADETFYRTSFRRPVIYGGDLYTSVEIEHSEPSQGVEDSPGTVQITLPADDPIALELRSPLPPARPMVAIYQYHRPPVDNPTDIRQALYDIVSTSENGKEMTLTCATLLGQGDIVVPSGLIQRDFCTWATYDPLTCGVDPAEYTYEGIVTAIDVAPTGIIVTLDIAVANFDLDFFTLGDLSKGGKHVMIKEFLENPSQRQFILEEDLPGLVVGDVVTVLAGDDRTKETCHNKFHNSSRRFSFPNMPLVNPYYGQGLRA